LASPLRIEKEEGGRGGIMWQKEMVWYWEGREENGFGKELIPSKMMGWIR